MKVNVSRRIKATLSNKTEKRLSERHKLSAKPVEEDYSQVMLRININRDYRPRIKTGIFVPVSQWNETKEDVKNGEARMSIAILKTKIERLLELYATEQETITKEWLELVLSLTENIGFAELSKALVDDIIDKHLNPDNHIKLSFFELWEQYLKETKYTAIRERNMRVIIRALMRYKWFIKESKDKDFTLDVDTITKDTIYNIEDYLRNEYLLLEIIRISLRPSRQTQRNAHQRSQNQEETILSILSLADFAHSLVGALRMASQQTDHLPTTTVLRRSMVHPTTSHRKSAI